MALTWTNKKHKQEKGQTPKLGADDGLEPGRVYPHPAVPGMDASAGHALTVLEREMNRPARRPPDDME